MRRSLLLDALRRQDRLASLGSSAAAHEIMESKSSISTEGAESEDGMAGELGWAGHARARAATPGRQPRPTPTAGSARSAARAGKSVPANHYSTHQQPATRR